MDPTSIRATKGTMMPIKKPIATAEIRGLITFVRSNDRVERPATTPVPRPDAAHHGSRSAPTRC
jgi:hypothetical protein